MSLLDIFWNHSIIIQLAKYEIVHDNYTIINSTYMM